MLFSFLKVLSLSVSCVSGLNVGARSSSTAINDRAPTINKVINNDNFYNYDTKEYGYIKNYDIFLENDDPDYPINFMDINFPEQDVIKDIYFPFVSDDLNGRTIYISCDIEIRYDYNESTSIYTYFFAIQSPTTNVIVNYGLVEIDGSVNGYNYATYKNGNGNLTCNYQNSTFKLVRGVVLISPYANSHTRLFFDTFFTRYIDNYFDYTFDLSTFNPYGWMGHNNYYFAKNSWYSVSHNEGDIYAPTMLKGVFVDLSGNIYQGIRLYYQNSYKVAYPYNNDLGFQRVQNYDYVNFLSMGYIKEIGNNPLSYNVVDALTTNVSYLYEDSDIPLIDTVKVVDNTYSFVSNVYSSIKVLYYEDSAFTDLSTEHDNDTYILSNLNRFDALKSFGNSGFIDPYINQYTGFGNTFTLINLGLNGIFGLFGLYILPGISIGALLFLPFILTILLFIIKLFKR